jgi:hypothetical protein
MIKKSNEFQVLHPNSHWSVGLNAYLHRFKKADTPAYEHCATENFEAKETIQHYLFKCPAWASQHHKLSCKVGHHKANTLEGLLQNNDNTKHLLE